ncbi:MAG: imidazole glycerol phosphate synthase subunit HisH [Gammaproteobacteria bacterium]|nr:imidazole glycerol phosphate synthase subunit HisH [Gammaproteobacteria bacterium]
MMPGTKTVGIIDYQAGNLQSLQNAIRHLGANVMRITNEQQFQHCSHIVLPGVGAFGFCANQLEASGLIPSLKQWAFDAQKPLLGICVGMQLLSDHSAESLGISGLGWIGGAVHKIPPSSTIRVPHVGWNSVVFEEDYNSFPCGEKQDFYFDHSFAYGSPQYGMTIGSSTHGVKFSAVVKCDNIVAVQFHPEKSQDSGLRFLKDFLET